MRRAALLSLLVLGPLLTSGVPAHGGPYEDGIAAFNMGDFSTAMSLLRPLAEGGNADAETYVGRMYAEGRGVARDGFEAARWYRKAAEQGQPFAEMVLGAMYYSRQPPNYKEAAKWYRKAADHGLVLAQYVLGSMYEQGQGVPLDLAEAAKWYSTAIKNAPADAEYLKGQSMRARNRLATRLASSSGGEPGEGPAARAENESIGALDTEAEQTQASNVSLRASRLEDGVAAYAKGDYATAAKIWRRLAEHRNADAAYGLGWMYENGKGVARDDREAAGWYLIAAARGDAAAQAKLGVFYRDAQGVMRDLVQSYVWFSAAAGGSVGKAQADSARQREEIAAELAPDELVRAEQRAFRCQGSEFKDCD
jgi:TPR repeat protein